MRKMLFTTLAAIASLVLVTACDRSAREDAAKPADTTAAKNTHEHADGAADADHGHEHADEASAGHGREHDGEPGEHGDHAHDDEVSLGTFTINGMEVELAQGHGKVEPGKEGHLVVKLPYSDNGATVVRAWIGTEDRTMSLVGKGDYAASHDDFDVHAVAPDPLPENAMWWIEVEKPDGSKAVGSAKPLLE